MKLNLSGYVEGQWRLTQRVAGEMQLRLTCAAEMLPQSGWNEPRMRVSTDPLDITWLQRNETAAWNA